jgi:tRNA-modifying protein YgfZ
MTSDAATVLTAPAVLTADEVASYDALSTDAVWWESQGNWCSFRGDKAADALNGLITNDVSTLAVGDGLHAAALSPKGKMVADMLVFRLDETAFVMTILRSAVPAWMDLVRKYVNPRLAKVVDEAERYRSWMVYGARAPQAIAALGGGDATAEPLSDGMVSMLSEWPVWRHAPWNIGPVSVRLIRAPLMGTRPGFILMADSADATQVQQCLEGATIRKGTRNVWNVSRVEAGRPAMGLDMDESTIPQEANLDSLGAISFTKGCYTGQETVARVHFRGHVNRHLRGLIGHDPLPQGALVTDETGKSVGDVRSTVLSPRLGPIAMGMIRREVPVGATVSVGGPDGPIVARVVELPFPAE